MFWALASWETMHIMNCTQTMSLSSKLDDLKNGHTLVLIKQGSMSSGLRQDASLVVVLA